MASGTAFSLAALLAVAATSLLEMALEPAAARDCPRLSAVPPDVQLVDPQPIDFLFAPAAVWKGLALEAQLDASTHR